MQHLVEKLLDGVAGQRPGSGQQFIQQNAEGIDIRQVRHVAAGHLFGSHVVWRAHGVAGAGQAQVRALGDAEIHHLDRARGVELDVLGLDVAVDDLLLVDVLQGLGHLERDAQLAGQVAGMPVLHGAAQILAAQKLRHHVRAALVLAEVVHAHDVLMSQASGQLGLAQKARFGVGVGGGFGLEDLHRHGAPNDGVARPVDARHAAAEILLKLVLAYSLGIFHH